MKPFIIALCVFILVSAAVVANAIHLNRFLSEMEDAIDSTPETPDEEAVAKLMKMWEHTCGFCCLSVSHREADAIENALTQMKCYAAAGNRSEYLASRGLLMDTVKRMRRAEALSMDRIL